MLQFKVLLSVLAMTTGFSPPGTGDPSSSLDISSPEGDQFHTSSKAPITDNVKGVALVTKFVAQDGSQLEGPPPINTAKGENP